jgi:hypothetical protein
MENLGGKIQIMIWSRALIPWALFPLFALFLDFQILDFYGSYESKIFPNQIFLQAAD